MKLVDQFGKPLDNGGPKKSGKPQLRGQKLNEIRAYINDPDKDWKQRALKYGEFLEWFFQKFHYLEQAMNMQLRPGVWNATPYMRGIANGLIIAMAVMVEEQDEVPIRKIPEKYELEEQSVEMMALNEHIQSLEKILAAGIKSQGKKDGFPEGFSGADDPWMRYWKVAYDLLQATPVNSADSKKRLHAIDNIVRFPDDEADRA